jgi:sigma-B regulation protein RsbU (phosphoserine phosphatase)
VLAAGAVSERNSREALSREVEGRLLSQARSLSLAGGDALLSDFPELTLHPFALELKNRQPELALIVVLDRGHRILGDPDPRRLGSVFKPERPLGPVHARQPLRQGEQMLSDNKMLVASVPVWHRDGRWLGTSMVGLQLRYLDDVIERARRQETIVLAIVLAFGVTATTLLMAFLLRPIAVLRAGIERIGRGDLDTPVVLRDRTELGVLADAVNHMAAQLKQAQFELIERERLAHELELARQIQSSLLPVGRLAVGSFVIEGSNRAAQEVGGDYFDYFELADGRVGIAIADVAGKGLAGCMVMSMLSALLRAYRDAHTSPSNLLVLLDERLGETLQIGSFVTMFYGVLDTRTGELTYANAGHNPLLVYSRSQNHLASLASEGIPLGAIRGGAIRSTLTDATVRLEPGDFVVQFTDGVSEAFEPSGEEQFGCERLEQVILASAPAGAASVLGAIRNEIEAWVGDGPQFDDETLVVVARADAAPGHGKGGTLQLVPVAMDPPDSVPAPLELLAEARSIGARIELTGQPDHLAALRPWLEACGAARDLERAEFEIMYAALHEACANVAEHGYGNDATMGFELWHVPGANAAATDTEAETSNAAVAASASARQARRGFLIRDDGVAFQANNWQATDFNDPQARQRGRGIGLDIIHRGMHLVSYHPGTPEGNITIMTFDPADLTRKLEERRHA